MNETSKKNRAVSASASDIDANAEDDIVATQTVDSEAATSDAGDGCAVTRHGNASTSSQQESSTNVETINNPGSRESRAALSHTDHGWAWMVLAGSCINTFVLGATKSCFSVLFVEFLNIFQEDKSLIALVGSLQAGITWMGGPVFARLAEEYSYRVIVMTGGMLAAFGMCLSYGAENIYVLIGAYGLLTGFGMSMIYSPSQIIVAFYFEKKRSLATGLIQAASAVGSLSGPLLCVLLLHMYTWHGTMFILGGIYLQTVAAAAMFRGIPRAAKEELMKRREDRNTRLGMAIADMIKLGTYFLNNLAYVIGGSTLTTYCVLLGTRRGMSLTRAAQMLTVLQVSNAISRFLVAAVGDRRWFPRHLVFGFTPFVDGIISLMFLRAETVWAFALCCVLYETSYGVRASMETPILVDLLGIHNLPMVQSIYILFGGIGILTEPVAAGFLMDRYTGDPRPVFMLSGISCIVSGVLQGGALCINYRQKRASEEPPRSGRRETLHTILEETRF